MGLEATLCVQAWKALAQATEVIKLFSCSTQLSMKFQLPIKIKMLKNNDFSCFQPHTCCIYHANKCYNANSCWHFNIYEHDKFHAQLS